MSKRGACAQFIIIKGPSVLTMALIGYTLYGFNFRFLSSAPNYLGMVITVLFGIAFNLSMIMGIWSYGRILCTPPGHPSKDFKEENPQVYENVVKESQGIPERQRDGTPNDLESNPGEYKPAILQNNEETKLTLNFSIKEEKNEPLVERNIRNSESENVSRHAKFRYCKSCDNIKPPRAHHCSTCQKCILRMDHHCPWVGNCVGLDNHKYFVLFLVYACTSGIISTAGMLTAIFVVKDKEDSDKISSDIHFLICGGISLAVTCAVGLLLCVHIYLLCVNETTIEAGSFKGNNPFRESTCRKNFEVIFGTNGWTWFIPVVPSRQNTKYQNIEQDHPPINPYKSL
ncbi:unnamed protein product [Moneuplotes crassus]|uniref:Palmitoyltransferase n=1 Tax=Euplotes crassus TaxID=5936 RepID=A0AAD2CZ36_EUPCR|nr:unnamed protein product [Moneuplotes crassus]